MKDFSTEVNRILLQMFLRRPALVMNVQYISS